jgi:fructosamine-3-kinase
MPQESDISWPVLRQITRRWAGDSAELAEVKPLAGGCINTTLALSTAGGDRAVLKISPHRVNLAYADEEHQLRLLRESGVPTPAVYACSTGSLDEPFSYILLEFIEGVDLNEARRRATAAEFDRLQAELAELMLRIHDCTDSEYRRVTANGAPAYSEWPPFYRTVFDPIWRQVKSSPLLPIKVRKQIGKIHERLDRFIGNADQPRLVHWDVWATNVLCGQDADGHWRVSALLDPNCKFAHVEAELAYMELFHTATPAFMKAYQQSRRLPTEYHSVRKPIYQLYSLLNHIELFGQDYVKPLMAAANKVAALI